MSPKFDLIVPDAIRKSLISKFELPKKEEMQRFLEEQIKEVKFVG